jgi:hypothetical protein
MSKSLGSSFDVIIVGADVERPSRPAVRVLIEAGPNFPAEREPDDIRDPLAL